MRESIRDKEQGLGAPDPIGAHYGAKHWDVLGGIGERMRGGILGIEVRKQYGNRITWASLSVKKEMSISHTNWTGTYLRRMISASSKPIAKRGFGRLKRNMESNVKGQNSPRKNFANISLCGGVGACLF